MIHLFANLHIKINRSAKSISANSISLKAYLIFFAYKNYAKLRNFRRENESPS